ncbi:hypothetical protein KIW84_013784 [Lathyrus oleraceus]|uniref:Ubiquitin-like protease family profile domain-containing protein n=1 Tax=Pisum sativum TaxID=3888 RepID=A0A9D5BL41_PEA|nr:hypothetical protein KIW84_013784 [Pisum sativum]
MASTSNSFTVYSNVKVSLFEGENYEFWDVKMETLFTSLDVLEFVHNGYEEPAPTEAEESSQRLEELKKKKKIKDVGVLGMIQREVFISIFPRIMRAKTSKEAWNILQQEFEGDSKGNGQCHYSPAAGTVDKMANQDDTHDASGSRNNVEKEIKRGLTVMKSIIRARDKGEKFEVHWSAEDQLIEPNGSMLASYIGSLVRQHIPITCDNWRSPELKVGKEKIWSEIQRSFHIDESRQKYCIQLAGKRLRGFRSFLSNKFLKDEEGNFVEAERPMKYAEIISAEEWDNFVAKRRNEKFHLTEEKSDATSLPEHVLWKAARVGKDGVVVEAVQNVYDECTPTRPTHKAGKGISRRIESVASQKEVPGRKLKKAGNDIPTTSGTKSQIMMRLEKMVEESDIMHGAIRSVDFDEGVFGFAHSEIIAKEDMQQLFEHEELGIAVIHTYIWYMYVTLMRGTELCNRFNFIAASRINTTFRTKNPTSVKNELVDRFMAAGDNTTPSLYFLPFNSGNGGHWVLLAMDLSRLMVYYLDSLSGDWSKYPSMKKTVDAAEKVCAGLDLFLWNQGFWYVDDIDACFHPSSYLECPSCGSLDDVASE